MAKAKGVRNSKATVRKFFPKVTDVYDATEPLVIQVTKADVAKAKRSTDHASCAMAEACRRELKADGVVIGMSTAYVVRGHEAWRYLVPPSVGREVTANDRGGTVEPGEYHLSPVNPSRRFGEKRLPPKDHHGKRDGSRSRHIHLTGGIRAILGSA